uniref:Ubiquitin carboxyl-terminal hydrolase n=1 Tax=Syphacia muris TaxID=451379 RepID=A0A0N5APM4_9BILA
MELNSEISQKDLLEYIRLAQFNIPSPTSKVFKDECMYCFNTPLHPDGLYICLKTFAGFCKRHLKRYSETTGQKAFVHLKQTKQAVESEAGEPQDKVTKLAIGIDGGFCSSPEFRTLESAKLVIYPDLDVEIDFSRLEGNLHTACANIASSSGVRITDQLESGVSGWDGETRIVTKHANLEQSDIFYLRIGNGCEQLPNLAKVDKHIDGLVIVFQLENNIKIPSSGWKCECDGCGLTENLWLNLTDGAIKCGRSQYISESVRSKGSNHMKEHYEKHKYPLVVKLGTIGKEGAEVFSYDEDEFVEDPNLRAHLLHFGIDMDNFEKTEKSTLELELDLNKKWEWSVCTEDGNNLELAYGPSLTGMINIGSSCYINASVQMLLQIPQFVEIYGKQAEEIFAKYTPLESHDNFDCQTAKVMSCLISGDYSRDNLAKTFLLQKGSEFNGIAPTQFKRVIGRGHPEFASCRQQDAEEYIRYFLSKVDDSISDNNPVDAVRFSVENRFVDNASGYVRYDRDEEFLLSLTVPQVENMKEAMSSDDSEVKRPTVTLSECLSASFSEQQISDFRSPITGEELGATQRIRLATFPDFLIIQLKKFVLTDNYTISKMDVNVLMNETIDLEVFRAKGQQPGEQLLPDGESIPHKKEPQLVNETFVEMLCGMGFTRAAARRALYETKNVDVDAAVDWIFQHQGDDDLNTEHPALVRKDTSVDPSLVCKLAELGFTAHQAKCALREHGNNLQSAVDWLFSNADKIPNEEEKTSINFKFIYFIYGFKIFETFFNCLFSLFGSRREFLLNWFAFFIGETCNTRQYKDGNSKYQLIGFISHMGSSPHSGHYIAHLRKNDTWYIFNDEKVAISKNPPVSLAYIYLYRRI